MAGIRDSRGTDPQWNLFGHEARVAARTRAGSPANHTRPSGALFLPPTLGPTLESEPLELVHLLRDEMANLAWGVERYTNRRSVLASIDTRPGSRGRTTTA